MKRLIISLLIAALLSMSFSGCSSEKTIDGVTYETYGLFDEGKNRNPNIEYEVVWGNVVWAFYYPKCF